MSRLSKEKLEEFYVRRIQPGLAKHGRGRPPWRQPTVLFILGQPGAGKTTMQAAAMDRLGMKKAYVLDHDELLEKHPEYAGAALDDDYSATVGHAEDAAQWRGRALHDVQERRMDVVVPYPIGNLELMRSFQEKGYRVEVAFAAVHESQSQLGIMERFNDSRQEVGYGRWIDAAQHDQLYRDMLETADAIEAEGAADAVHVYRRGEAEPVFTNEQKNGVWRHQLGSSRWAIETEANRPWTDREVNHFVRGYNRLAALASLLLKDHFKAMPLMATPEGNRLLAKLHQTAAPKIAEHQRLATQKAQAEAARAQAAQQPVQQPQAVPQQPTQHPNQVWQQQPQQPAQQQPQQTQQAGRGWGQQPSQQPQQPSGQQAVRPQQAQQQPQQPTQPQQPKQMPPPPRHAPHQQHVAQSWQEQATQHQPQHLQQTSWAQQQAVAGSQDTRWAAGVQGGPRAVGQQQVPPPQHAPHQQTPQQQPQQPQQPPQVVDPTPRHAPDPRQGHDWSSLRCGCRLSRALRLVFLCLWSRRTPKLRVGSGRSGDRVRLGTRAVAETTVGWRGDLGRTGSVLQRTAAHRAS